jgi:FkbM family methyltransferase
VRLATSTGTTPGPIDIRSLEPISGGGLVSGHIMSTRPSKVLWHLRSVVNRVPGAYAAFRYVTTHFGEGKVYRMRTGPMRGLRWRRYNVLNFWYHLGLFEPHVSRLIESSLRPGDRFWDIGANGGYHTLLAARRLGPDGHVLAVEANPELAPLIESQLRLNDMANCTVMSVAVSNREGVASFAVDANSLKSSLSDGKSTEESTVLEIRTTTLDALLEVYPPPDLVKIDVEGAEVQVLEGGQRLMAAAGRPLFLVSTHGQQTAARCEEILRGHGYAVSPVPGFAQMLSASPLGPSAEGTRSA